MRYIMILILSTGEVGDVRLLPSYEFCIAQSQFELRYDERVLMVTCQPHGGDEA